MSVDDRNRFIPTVRDKNVIRWNIIRLLDKIQDVLRPRFYSYFQKHYKKSLHYRNIVFLKKKKKKKKLVADQT